MSGPMSLKIKIPRPSEQPVRRKSQTPSHVEPASARRKSSNKRRVLSDDEGDYADAGDGADEPYNHNDHNYTLNANRPPLKRTRRSVSAFNEVELEVHVDIEGRDGEPEPEPSSSVPIAAAANAIKRRIDDIPQGSRVSSSAPHRKKKRISNVVYTSDEDGEGVGPRARDDEDFDIDMNRKREKEKERGRSHLKGRSAGKKVKKEEKQIFFKDERKVVPGTGGGIRRPIGKEPQREREGREKGSDKLKVKREEEDSKATTASPPRGTTPALLLTTVTATDTEAASTSVPAPESSISTLPPIPKKRKLPTIKKNKPAVASTSSVSTPAQTPYPKRPGDEKDSPPADTGGERRLADEEATGGRVGGEGDGLKELLGKKKSGPGNSDFDLRNKDVYASLFKSAGGNTPRSGLNRKEKELERRKELDKMREEARARRLEESKHTFSLASSPTRVGVFEDVLKERKSSAAFPNILCGKVREVWEGAKREREERRRGASGFGGAVNGSSGGEGAGADYGGAGGGGAYGSNGLSGGVKLGHAQGRGAWGGAR